MVSFFYYPCSQTSWADVVPQTVVSTPVTTAVIASTATAPAIPVSTKTEAPATCNWTEHTSPEGYKYYYNSVTRESRVSLLLSLDFVVYASFCSWLTNGMLLSGRSLRS